MIRPINDQETTAPDLPKIIQSIFASKGLLSTFPGFEYREQQQQMAVSVSRALEESHHLAAEAGTGVGKSYGYLIPAVLHALAHRHRVIVSTHTINLQEQLLENDIPYVRKLLQKLQDKRFSSGWTCQLWSKSFQVCVGNPCRSFKRRPRDGQGQRTAVGKS